MFYKVRRSSTVGGFHLLHEDTEANTAIMLNERYCVKRAGMDTLIKKNLAQDVTIFLSSRGSDQALTKQYCFRELLVNSRLQAPIPDIQVFSRHPRRSSAKHSASVTKPNWEFSQEPT